MADDEESAAASDEEERMKMLMDNWERENNEEGGDTEKKKKKKDKKKDKKKKDKKDKKGKDTDTVKSKESTKDKKDKKKKDKKKDKKKKDKKRKSKAATEGSGITDAATEAAAAASATATEAVADVEIDDDDASDNSEDARMKELLQNWEQDAEESESDESDDDEDEEDDIEEMGATKADLNLADNVLDHVILAAPNLQEAVKEFENMTGIKPHLVGSMRGLGTKTARVGLANNCYIEILAPDPKNAGPIGAELAQLGEGDLIPYHYAIRQTDVKSMQEDFVPNELGWEPDHISMFGAKPDGTPRKWEMLFMHGHNIGGAVPFYIDWGLCDHPTASIPEVGELKSFTIRAPSNHKVHDLLSSVEGINCEEGDPMIEFAFASPEGLITFSGDFPKGLKFPGFNDSTDAVAAAAQSTDAEGGEAQFPGMPELLPTSGDKGDDNGDDSGSNSGSDSGSDDDDDDSASNKYDDDADKDSADGSDKGDSADDKEDD